MNSVFNIQILADKLSKLNNSRQSIETLSHWCIFHRNKASQIVETWDKQFRELPIPQRVPFLYLANDILQNSKRRGNEFVNEFWRILPDALKDVLDKSDDAGRNTVWRLVDIWEERKVFGSRGQSLKEELLGRDPMPELGKTNLKTSPMVKIKVPSGGMQEKLTSAYESVHDVAAIEDATLGRCNAAVVRIEGIEKEASGQQTSDASFAHELQEQQSILAQCAEQLEISEMARAALIAHLKEALHEQESKLELVRTQLQIAQAHSGHAVDLRHQVLANRPCLGEIIEQRPGENGSNTFKDAAMNPHPSEHGKSFSSIESMAPIIGDSMQSKSAAAIAAEVAAKLAASSSSAQMLTSVLSSFAAEESCALRTLAAPLDAPLDPLPPDKRQKLGVQLDNMHEGRMFFPLPTALQSNASRTDTASSQRFTSPMQQQLPPPPPVPPQSQFMPNSVGTMNIADFGFGGVAPPLPQAPPPAAPPPPPPPPPSPLPTAQPYPMLSAHHPIMQLQSMASRPQRIIQQSRMSFYTQMPLQSPSMPRP